MSLDVFKKVNMVQGQQDSPLKTYMIFIRGVVVFVTISHWGRGGGAAKIF